MLLIFVYVFNISTMLNGGVPIFFRVTPQIILWKIFVLTFLHDEGFNAKLVSREEVKEECMKQSIKRRRFQCQVGVTWLHEKEATEE
jgi:hypothetical protein